MAQLPFATALVTTIQANATITAASNAAPIAVTTSAAHGLVTGDIVQQSGVTGNLAANGKFTVTKVDSTHYTLNNSNGSGAYVSGGTAQHIGHQVPNVLVDNTVYATVPAWTAKFRMETLTAATGYRAVFSDAGDVALLTEEPMCVFAGTGAQFLSSGRSYSIKQEDCPDARMAASGDNMTFKIYLSGGPGVSAQYSAWLE